MKFTRIFCGKLLNGICENGTSCNQGAPFFCKKRMKLFLQIVSVFGAAAVLIGEKLFSKKVWCRNWTTSSLSLS